MEKEKMSKILYKSPKLNFIILSLCVFLGMANANAEKPKWVGNPPVEGNSSYKFVEVTSSGGSVSAARANALSVLAQDEQLAHAVEASVETGVLTNINQEIVDGETKEKINDNMTINVNLKGQNYKLQASKIDEYIAGEKYGEIQLHTLYMVAISDNPKFDRAYVTNDYGVAPVFMSIIPGAGQWYKGSKVKGGCIFAAEAVAVAGIIVCENQRASYIKKSKEHPKFAVQYGNKADSWDTGRNICIGVAAGLWVYNIIDAAFVKGAKRVVVKRPDGSGLAVAPYATFDGALGLSLAYKF
ncbi:MAG: hypothetical protein NC095_01260 [Muribaculum sp.]|nr:hypothetical protein [Muribaculum sp.]